MTPPHNNELLCYSSLEHVAWYNEGEESNALPDVHCARSLIETLLLLKNKWGMPDNS